MEPLSKLSDLLVHEDMTDCFAESKADTLQMQLWDQILFILTHSTRRSHEPLHNHKIQ